MKTILSLLILCVPLSLLAQGTVWLTGQNTGSGVSFRVYGPEPDPSLAKTGNTTADTPPGTQVYFGTPLSGSDYRAELWGAPGVNQPESALQPGSPGSSFRTGTAAGVVATTVVTFSNIPKDFAGGGTFQLRVWDNSSGLYPTWASALAATYPNWPALAAGPLLSLNATIGGDLTTPPPLAGMQSFGLYGIPEPAILSMAGLAALALLSFRKRK